MNLDLNNLLEGWPHEPGQIRVRKVLGNDGREKLQLRIDLGLIQMETSGRPDGQRPHGSESLLDWHEERAEAAETQGEEYRLTSEECHELQHEAIQYYHRYISLFQINDFAGVVRDTRRNLKVIDFVCKYADQDELGWPVDQLKAYLLMMNTRAKGSIELERHDYAAALRHIERGRAKIVEAFADRPEMVAQSNEVQFLDQWAEELQQKRPLSRIEQLTKEMDQAIRSEAYERAAELRDAIREEEAKGTA